MKTVLTSVLLSCTLFASERHVASGWPYHTIPQVADGGTWKTTIILANTDGSEHKYKLLLRGDDGSPKRFAIGGRGSVDTVSGTIPGGGTVTLETNGGGSQVNQGWAELDLLGTDSEIAIMAVFGTTGIAGRPDLEATVAGMSGVDYEGALPFDNTRGYVTAIAILNPSQYAASSVPVRITDENGAELRRETLTLQPGRKLTFTVPDRWPEAVGKRGAVQFAGSFATSWSVLGLRFHPSGAFTTINLLEK